MLRLSTVGTTFTRNGTSFKFSSQSVSSKTHVCCVHLSQAAVVDDSVFCVHGGIPRRVGPNFQNMLDAVNHLPKRMSVMPSYSYETQDHVNLVRHD